MAASLFRLSRPRCVLLPFSALRLPLSTQPLPQPRDPSSPNSNRGLPAFLAAAAAGGTTASVALCDASPENRVGGKDSTELVVRGERKRVPQEFIEELASFLGVAMCNFQTVKDAADVAIATMHSGIQVSRVELLDEVQIRAINMANGKSLPEVPTLMFEFIGTEAYALEQTLLVQKIAAEHHGSDFVFVEEPNAKEELWKIRKEALWAGFAMKPDHEAMITDVCVPLSRLAECISVSKQLLDASSLTCLVIAHAGDGNFHTIILFDPSQEEQRREAERLNHFMVRTAQSMEGTCTGEHGVGTGKMKYLEKELGMESLRTMKRIKAALDPNNIMNPGKLIPPHVCI